jgi:hypothetical protein
MPEQSDLGWIREKLPIEDVARELGLEVRRHRARCWRPENHRNGDAHPSLTFHARKNRARCWICDQAGAMSNIDMVMQVLPCDFAAAVCWICERFSVPSAKRGRPIGPRFRWHPRYRVGTSGSQFELLVRSGLWAELTSAERSLLEVLCSFKDEVTGATDISFIGLRQYSGVGSFQDIARAIEDLERKHALKVERRQGVGVLRACNRYRLTLDDPDFLRLLREVYRGQREEIERERAFRREARVRRLREKKRGAAREITFSVELGPK